jgi:LPXTG-motif cell wall-anchored protein
LLQRANKGASGGDMGRNGHRVTCCAVFLVASFGLAVPASAQTAGDATYTGVTPPELGGVQVSGVEAQQVALPQSSTSQLPLTGTDVAELAGLGLVLIGSGAVLRRSGRARRIT